MDDGITFIIFLVISAGAVGAVIGAMLEQNASFNQEPEKEKTYIDKYIKALEDCKVKEYFYIDEHREYCIMIGVTP